MTSLAHYLKSVFPEYTIEGWQGWAETYIKELEQHMKSRDWEHPSDTIQERYGWNCAILEMLRFLRGETK